MNQNELDKLVDQGLERLMKKAAIQAEIKAKALAEENAADENLLWLVFGVFSLGYSIHAWSEMQESGDFTKTGIVLLALAAISALLALYKCTIYQLYILLR